MRSLRLGQVDCYYVQAIKKIVSEPAGLDLVVKVAVGCRKHPDIDRNDLFAADSFEAMILEKPQQEYLYGRSYLADFVQKKRTAMSTFDPALFLMGRTGECPFFVTEDLAFEQGGE